MGNKSNGNRSDGTMQQQERRPQRATGAMAVTGAKAAMGHGSDGSKRSNSCNRTGPMAVTGNRSNSSDGGNRSGSHNGPQEQQQQQE